MTDQFDRAKAKANVEDAVTRHPDIAGMVGLFGYNPPLILEALDRVRQARQSEGHGASTKTPARLQGIKDGNVVATVVQNPYQYGYQSVKSSTSCTRATSRSFPRASSSTFLRA